ncbi:hypothetical protein SAMN02744786_0690 [Stenotrophomonas sp. CC120222-04]|nr:hypothetical protein SAMN02744786_0690 [Stenotrophomonas sp. CC120222-04]
MGVPAGRHPARRPVGFVARACGPGPAEATATTEATAEAATEMPDLAGRCGLAGHAVNPAPRSGPAAGGCAFGRLRSSASQAKRPHPWGLDGAIHGANGPASPHRPTSDRSRRIVSRSAVGRCRPWSTHIHATRGCERSDPLLTLTFLFFDFPWRTHTETVRGRAGGLRRGVSRMDAATELTGTYLQRPLRSPPARPNHGF